MQGQRQGHKVAFSTGSPKKSDSPVAHGNGDESFAPYYLGKDGAKQQGILNRTFNTLNPFKSKKVGGGWFDPEEFTSQKREWAKHFGGDNQPASENHKLFESFFVAGLPPSTDVKSVTADTETTKTARHDHLHMRFAREASKETEHRGSKGEAMDAQILYSFPPEKAVAGAVASYCFPHGVNPVLLERTPSMSSLNEIIYGQRFLHSDACSFVFLMKVADDLPLYGVCCYMEELVHRPPAILSGIYDTQPAPLSRYLVSAPRCYCMLTHYPFFSLHLKVLHMIMGLERLDRITAFTEEASRGPENPSQAGSSRSASPPRPKPSFPNPENGKKPPPSPSRPGPSSQPSATSVEGQAKATSQILAEAIKRASTGSEGGSPPQLGVEGISARPASFSGPQKGARPSHRRSSSAMTGLPPVPSNVEPRKLSSSLSRASARMRLVIDKQEAATLRNCEETEAATPPLPDLEVPEASEGSTASFQTAGSNYATVEDLNNSLSPNKMRHSSSAGALSRHSAPSSPWDERAADQRGDQGPAPGTSGRLRDGGFLSSCPSDLGGPTRSAPSFRTLLKSQSLRPHVHPEPHNREGEAPAGALQVMQAYHDAAVPQPGQDFEFSADDTLQPVHYYRPPLHLERGAPEHVHRTQIANAEAEAAAGLRNWTVAVLCRCLSLENVLLLLTAVLLEQQVVVFCPNIGILSTAVLSLIPLLRPFAWQSLLMPVLPALDQMLNLMDAPVPFVMGVQYKTSDIASRCTGLVRVNIYKDTVVNAERLPPLPGLAALHAMLEPAYAALRSVSHEAAHSRPTYNVTDAEKRAADDFLTTTEGYLGGLCSKLHLHAITDVQTGDRVAVLMKDSFIESFDAKDRNFARMFVETQMFEVYCDTTML